MRILIFLAVLAGIICLQGLPLPKRESMVWFGAAHHLLPVRIADCAVKYDSSCGRARFQLCSHNGDNVLGV